MLIVSNRRKNFIVLANVEENDVLHKWHTSFYCVEENFQTFRSNIRHFLVNKHLLIVKFFPDFEK